MEKTVNYSQFVGAARCCEMLQNAHPDRIVVAEAETVAVPRDPSAAAVAAPAPAIVKAASVQAQRDGCAPPAPYRRCLTLQVLVTLRRAVALETRRKPAAAGTTPAAAAAAAGRKTAAPGTAGIVDFVA
jgi:hypothetical protein